MRHDLIADVVGDEVFSFFYRRSLTLLAPS